MCRYILAGSNQSSQLLYTIILDGFLLSFFSKTVPHLIQIWLSNRIAARHKGLEEILGNENRQLSRSILFIIDLHNL